MNEVMNGKPKRRAMTLKEREAKALETLEKLKKQISARAKKILGNIFYDLMKDDEISRILEERGQDRVFKELLNKETKKIILELDKLENENEQ